MADRLDGETIHMPQEKEDRQRMKRRNGKMRKVQQQGREQESGKTQQNWLRPQRLLHREQTNVPTSSIHEAQTVGNPQRLDHLQMLGLLMWWVYQATTGSQAGTVSSTGSLWSCIKVSFMVDTLLALLA